MKVNICKTVPQNGSTNEYWLIDWLIGVWYQLIGTVVIFITITNSQTTSCRYKVDTRMGIGTGIKFATENKGRVEKGSKI